MFVCFLKISYIYKMYFDHVNPLLPLSRTHQCFPSCVLHTSVPSFMFKLLVITPQVLTILFYVHGFGSSIGAWTTSLEDWDAEPSSDMEKVTQGCWLLICIFLALRGKDMAGRWAQGTSSKLVHFCRLWLVLSYLLRTCCQLLSCKEGLFHQAALWENEHQEPEV